MIKTWLITPFHKKFFLGEIEKKKFDLRFCYYKKSEMAENEFLVYVPLDVYQYYFKS